MCYRSFVHCLVVLAAGAMAGAESAEPLGFKEHWIRVGDSHGGWTLQKAEIQLLHSKGASHVMPFGVSQLDNGEVMFLGSAEMAATENKPRTFTAVTAFSRDGGQIWSELTPVPGAPAGPQRDANKLRPYMLTDLGKGHMACYLWGCRLWSHDYGRTWPERVALPSGSTTKVVLNVSDCHPLVDRDATGAATRIAEIRYRCPPPGQWPDAYEAVLYWSADGGRTWSDGFRSTSWKTEMEWKGKRYLRGVSEGAVARAANGDLVAALRIDVPPRYYADGQKAHVDFDDSLEGLGVSRSSDNGKTWSPLAMLFEAGRHHAHLIPLPGGQMVMTYIVRVDVAEGRLASYRRGCEALVSRDNGRTWDLGHRYILDGFNFFDGKKWFHGETGHLCSTLLKDGRILTVYGNYVSKGACVIRWRPN